MDAAERIAAQRADTVCLGVGLCREYGSASGVVRRLRRPRFSASFTHDSSYPLPLNRMRLCARIESRMRLFSSSSKLPPADRYSAPVSYESLFLVKIAETSCIFLEINL